MSEPKNMFIKVKPYDHQTQAFNFVCTLFGITKDGDAINIFKSNGAALLMEMG